MGAWLRCSGEASGALWMKRVRRWCPAGMTRCGILNEGLAAVRRGGKWGFVDEAGQEVVPCRYDEVRDFEEGPGCGAAGRQVGLCG